MKKNKIIAAAAAAIVGIAVGLIVVPLTVKKGVEVLHYQEEEPKPFFLMVADKQTDDYHEADYAGMHQTEQACEDAKRAKLNAKEKGYFFCTRVDG